MAWWTLPEQVGATVLGYQVIGKDADLPFLRCACPAAVLAIGQFPYPAPRQRLAPLLLQLGFHYRLCISHHAVVSRHAQLGAGTVIGHVVIVNAVAVVGVHCTLNSRALIEQM